MTDKKDDTPGKPTLDETQIDSKRGLNRRTMLRGFGIGGLGLGTAAATGCVPIAVGPGYGSGITDADNGPIIDSGGCGRGGRRGYYTGYTDADNGPIVDPGGQGRGPRQC
jgi:hypothetical protein